MVTKLYRNESSLRLLLGTGGLLCTSCCPPGACGEFGSTLDLTIAGLILCGSTSYNPNCFLADPFDAYAELDDPNGVFRLNYGDPPGFWGNQYFLVSGDWLYLASCYGAALWSVRVMMSANAIIAAMVTDGAVADEERLNWQYRAQDCGDGNCEDTFGECGYAGTSLVEYVP